MLSPFMYRACVRLMQRVSVVTYVPIFINPPLLHLFLSRSLRSFAANQNVHHRHSLPRVPVALPTLKSEISEAVRKLPSPFGRGAGGEGLGEMHKQETKFLPEPPSPQSSPGGRGDRSTQFPDSLSNPRPRKTRDGNLSAHCGYSGPPYRTTILCRKNERLLTSRHEPVH
jgi:hypothetical protein